MNPVAQKVVVVSGGSAGVGRAIAAEFAGHGYDVATAARAVRYIAEHRRRNMWVGVPTAYAILGNRLAPAVLDWYLGKTGVSGQLSDKPATRLGSNVFTSRDDDIDMGAHGAFDGKAHRHDPWSEVSMRRGPVLSARRRLPPRRRGRAVESEPIATDDG